MDNYYTATQANRALPTDEWIAEIRGRYPVENTVDEVFTRKLKQRHGTAGQDMDFTRLHTPLLNFLKNQTGQTDIEVLDLQRLSGGASKEQFTFKKVIRNMNSVKRVTESVTQ